MPDTTLRASDLPTGQADFYFLIENDAGNVWNGSAFLSYTVAGLPTYRMVATEGPAGSERYSFPFPAVQAGSYSWVLYKGAGATSDPRYSQPGQGYWDGSGFVAPPSAVQIRQEMDANSAKLVRLDVPVSTRMAAGAYVPPAPVPTVVQIRQEMDLNSVKLDVPVSTRLAEADIPTAVAIRQEMDANSVKLAFLDATISSRSTYGGGDTSGVTTLLNRLTAPRATGLDFLDAFVSSRLAATAYTPPPAYTTPPTVVQIRQEMDANSVKLANLDSTVSSRSTYGGADTPGTTTLLGRLTLGRAINLDFLDVAVSSRLAAASYVPPAPGTTPPSVVEIRQEMDANSVKLAFLDTAVSSRSTYGGTDTAGTTTLLGRLTDARAVNLDNLNATVSSRMAAASYVVPPTPPTVVQIRQEMDANSGKLLRLDTTVSSRSTYAGADTPGTLDLLSRLTEPRAANLDFLNVPVSSRLAAASYLAPVVPPTPAQIRQEMDANSVRLALLDAAVSTRSTYAGADTSGTTTLLGRLTEQRAGWLDTLNPPFLVALIGGPYPSAAEIVTAIFDEYVVNTTSFRILLASVAAPLAGNLVEDADHTTSQFTDINDPGGPPRITSTNAPTSRQVSVH